MFHVKHSPFFKPFIDGVKKNRFSYIKVDSFSLVPFVLSLFVNKKIFIVVDTAYFDSCYSSFPSNKGVLGLPFIYYKNLSSFYSFHETLFASSFDKMSSCWEDFAFCVVDSKVYKKPLFSKKKKICLSSSDRSFSYDLLLLFLKENNYKKVDLLLSPGEFVLRGFVVDVFSHGEKNPFRINFFKSPAVCSSFKLKDSLINSPLKSVNFLPKSDFGKKTVYDLIDKNSLVVTYKKGTLSIENKGVGSGDFFQKQPFVSCDYLMFKKLKKTEGTVSSWLSSSAVLFNGFIVHPKWFVEKKEKTFSLFSSPQLKLVEKDYYIHSKFGVCQFLGIEEQEKAQDRGCFKFSDGILKVDVLFLNLISHYSSFAAGNKKLNFLNKQKSWENKKNKVYNSAKNYVKNIVNNYAVRQKAEKEPFVFDHDTFSLFLSGFKYKDTADQIKSWGDILKDLCSNKPMDRLLCGDVGFGKTEIALRASFLSLYNNKSVVLVAPTTILAQQLLDCFVNRLSVFGYKCFLVSRLAKKTKASVQFFLQPKPTVLIGTHSIIKNKDVLRRASLFIVDEEHRFGVKDKEFVFSINPQINYLSMSATPIPRSLQFSLSNIRDISVMLSPPALRKPIITNVVKYDYSLLKNIIFNEISRKGQVFIVDNSVNNVISLYNKLSVSLGGVVVGCLFGSQEKKLIEKTMDLFRFGKITVLISTTIIESGIDIPRANTLVVLNSHLFGLSQLYQLRGRVGRSGQQGYAFLFVPDLKNITQNGVKRLSSLQKNSSLGSGYNVALADLEIRGPGSLFGYSQSGTALVGFDFYTKLLTAAVSSLFPGKKTIQPENLPLVSLGQAFIPKKYIFLDEERIFVYNFLSSCVKEKSLFSFFDRCVSKYGPPPPFFENLFKSKSLSLFLYNKDVSKILIRRGFVVFYFLKLKLLSFDSLVVSLDLFFKPRKIKYFFEHNKNSFTFRFNYKEKDVYILVDKLARFLYL